MKEFVNKFAPWALVVALFIAGAYGFFFTSNFVGYLGGDVNFYAQWFFAGLLTASVLVGAYVLNYPKMVPLALVVASVLALVVILINYQGNIWLVPIAGAVLIALRFAPRLFE